MKQPSRLNHYNARSGPFAREYWALSACADFRGDVLIVESEKDERIPREAMITMQDAFRQANSLSHRIIHCATHAMHDAQHQRIYATLLTG